MPVLQFPDDFIFGTSTAAYQIEGAWDEDGKGPSIWDDFSHTPGKIKDNSTGDVACDHYHRYKEDVALMKKLQIGAYRFSISWPRILPEGKGRVNRKGLDFYSRLVDQLLAAGIKPFVTLFHWDLPSALQAAGGWQNRETSDYFADYSELVVRKLGDRVKYWSTLNESLSIFYMGHLLGNHAPGIKDKNAALNAHFHLLLAHGKAFRQMKALNSKLLVGAAEGSWPAYPRQPEYQDLVSLAESLDCRFFLDPVLLGGYPSLVREQVLAVLKDHREGDFELIKTGLDYIGINNYSRSIIIPDPAAEFGYSWVRADYPGVKFTAFDWEVYPEALYRVITNCRSWYGDLPLYVLENGATFHDTLENGRIHDQDRLEFLRDYLAMVHNAIAEGCNVKGYFVWSLLDNFEWADGYTKPFGIVHVDFKTQQRTLKKSAHWYAEICRSGSLQTC